MYLGAPAIDHGGLSAREARMLQGEVQCLRDEASFLRDAGTIQADLTALATAAIAAKDRRIAELEEECGAWQRRYRVEVELRKELLRMQAAGREA